MKMLWLEYAIEQAGSNWRVKGDWPGEIMGTHQDGTQRDSYLYKPGDKFEVSEEGWLMKVEQE
jgi:hypothetical protein